MAYKFFDSFPDSVALYQVNDVEPDCSNCRFALFSAQRRDGLIFVLEHGRCRLHPPKVVTDTLSIYPIINVDDWCGDHNA
jgi:hypothetical protein